MIRYFSIVTAALMFVQPSLTLAQPYDYTVFSDDLVVDGTEPPLLIYKSAGKIILPGTLSVISPNGVLTAQAVGGFELSPGFVVELGGEMTLQLNSAASIDNDGDGIPDSWESTYGINATATGDHDGDGELDYYEWQTGTDPDDDMNYAPRIVSTAPVDQAVVPLPFDPETLLLTAVVDRLESIDRLKIYDRYGNDLTNHASHHNGGIELRINPLNEFAPEDPDLSEHLSGVDHEYRIVVERGGVTIREETIEFAVDAKPPVVTPDHASGRYDDAVTVSLTASETADIFFSTNGGPPDTSYTVPIVIDQTTVLRFQAVDPAGNIGPIGTAYYQFTDLPKMVTGLSLSYEAPDVEVSWAQSVAPVTGYHVYRAVNTLDRALLQESHDSKLPPPGHLRITTSPIALATAEYLDQEVAGSSQVMYAVSAVYADGNESAACSPLSISPSPGSPANRLASVDAALRWLEAEQAADGSWGGDTTLDRRIISTAQAMRAIARDGRWVADKPHLVRQGLSYLRGRFVDENDAIIRSIDALQRCGESAETLHTRLAIRGMTQVVGEDTHLLGWASHRHYYPDALHTALGLLARRDAAVEPPWVNDGTLLVGSSLQTATSGRYGWVPDSADDSIYVSAVVYAATHAHRYSSAGDYAWILSEGATDYRDSLLDTAAVLIYLPLDPTDRADAENLLIAGQNNDGSWSATGVMEGDPFLTALCLEALSHARVVHIRAETSTDDDAIGELFERRAVDLEVVDNDDALPSDISESDLIVVSSTATPTGFDIEDLRSLNVPMLVCKAAYFDEFGLTGVDASLHDVNTGVSSVQIALPGHPLSGGLGDGSPVTVLGAGSAASWGTPKDHAVIVATDPSTSTEAYVFAYEPNTINADGGLMPARRVGFYLGDNADDLEDEGKDLLDAAIEWLLYVRSGN